MVIQIDFSTVHPPVVGSWTPAASVIEMVRCENVLFDPDGNDYRCEKSVWVDPADRSHVRIDTNKMPYLRPAERPEIELMPLFRDLSPGELDVLLARLEPLAADTGEVIIRQEDAGERFFVVRSGRVEVSRDGRVLARLGPGEAFGEIALLLDVRRTASVTAVEPTTLLALEAHDFRDVLAGYLGRASELERLSHLRLLSHKRLDEVV